MRPAAVPELVAPGDEFLTYLEVRRETLANELREVERLLLKHGRIKRVLCAPSRVR